MDSMCDWELITPEEVKEYVDQNGVSNIDEYFKKKLERWQDIEVNIGITGDSGAGKSSYINAIRELKDDDEGAAEVGVTETTLEPTCYDHPTNPKIKFWDLPGIGTPNYPDLETYCNKVRLETYNAFLVFTNNRFTENDQKLAKKIRSIDKRFFFIRAKIDQSVESEKCKRSFNEDDMLEKIRRYCLENLVDEDGNQLANEQNIFLISNRYPAKWEFDRLTQAILDALPIYQRESLTLSLGILTSLSPQFLQRKVQVLKGRMWMVASLSAAAAVVPLPGLSIAVDLGLIMNEISFYISQLGLPEEGSPRFEMLSANTQREVKAFCATVTSVSQVGGLMAAYASEQAAEEVTRFIPFVVPENDKKLAKKIRSIDKRFFFIRAKIDQSVRAEKRKRSFNEDAAMLEKIRPNCLENLQFLQFPEVSIGADLALIMKEISFYKSQLGLPDSGSPRFAMLSVDTQGEVKAISAMLTSMTHVGLMTAYASEQAAEEITRFIPFVGQLIAGAMSFVSTYLFLKHCLEKMEKTALLVLREVLKD
ncbi:Interferon-inducible GTPase 5-like [Desmophyllum pertusum]|uniref:Interferon-inducible GTPase 5-like n=1 Tax=Desmophyllum pertusum TaxID=174260 RepID=A0A9W9YNN2_9CNID|nr:Interferon-inducible GTPase 5-like [Desmophyllum pertusum]